MVLREIVICGGAPHPYLEYLGPVSKDKYYIGVDRGAWHLLQAGYPVHWAVGDFDSVNQQELTSIFSRSQQVDRHPSEKDDTDMELALLHAQAVKGQVPITILGALGQAGGRLDHLLANLWLVHQDRFYPILDRLIMVEKERIVRFFSPGVYILENHYPCRYLSVISLTAVNGLSIRGAKYELEPTDFDWPRALISNEITPSQPINLNFEQGIVMVIWENGA